MRCEYCKKKKGMLLECKNCNKELCSRCIDLTIHKCDEIDKLKKRKREELENKLMSEKIESNKIIKI